MKISDCESELMDVVMNPAFYNNNDFGHFLTEEDSKLTLGDTADENIDQKLLPDPLDLLFSAPPANPGSFQELKPVAPLASFTNLTSHLSINGISGHHYNAIAAAPNSTPRILIETNNNSIDTANQNNVPYYSDIVSSSTIDIDQDAIIDIEELFGSSMGVPGNRSDGDFPDITEYLFNPPIISQTSNKQIEISVNSNNIINHSSSNDNNMNGNNNHMLCPENLPNFVPDSAFPLLQYHKQQHQSIQQSHHHPHMPILQNRLQNVPQKPDNEIAYNVSECSSPSSSTPYLAHSPPCHVVSTSDMGGYNIQVHSSTRPSPELQGSFPHTTTPNKKSRNRTKSRVASSIVYSDGNIGKEKKTMHQCVVCQRGFLNKSNIKVHLRTHTGEKPFRCDVCAKAFRQKAHLIKHAQIHKRIGRDVKPAGLPTSE